MSKLERKKKKQPAGFADEGVQYLIGETVAVTLPNLLSRSPKKR
ncbi:MAG TPA: hypothetical protein VH592_20850 [Gemmataceae bacterium]|jgi:hypothetical protein